MDTEAAVNYITQDTGFSKDDIEDMVREKMELLKGLISREGAIFIIMKELGVDTPHHSHGNEFRINKFLTLKLERGETNIYVKNIMFHQCKYLLLNLEYGNSYNEIESIDEAAETLDNSLEGHSGPYTIAPETEFWGHCSNLQTWVENAYDTRILHRNLAFPLLKALADAGDPIAVRKFKEEIALRLASAYPSVVDYLFEEGYINFLKKEELIIIFDDLMDLREFEKAHKLFLRFQQFGMNLENYIPHLMEKVDQAHPFLSYLAITKQIKIQTMERFNLNYSQFFKGLLKLLSSVRITGTNDIIEYTDGIFYEDNYYNRTFLNDIIDLIDYFKTHGKVNEIEQLLTELKDKNASIALMILTEKKRERIKELVYKIIERRDSINFDVIRMKVRLPANLLRKFLFKLENAGRIYQVDKDIYSIAPLKDSKLNQFF